MRPLEIGVVGAGTAGMAAALLLRRVGHAVTLIERVAEPGAVGAGIVLQPSGLGVLVRLGLDGPIRAAGARLDGLTCRNRRWTILDLRYARLASGLFGLGLHRGVLFSTLFEALSRSGVALVAGRAATRVEASGDRHFVRLEGAGRLGPFDLVVVADGARSALRAQVAPHAIVRPYPWGALWFVGDTPAEAPPRLVQAVHGTHEMIGLLPTGRGPMPGGPLSSLFVSVPLRAVAAIRAGDLGAFRAHLAAQLPEAAPLAAQLVRWEQLLVAAYHDVVLPAWHDRGVVLLGDAAHATSPQLGQGCNLALVDAETLAAAIDTHETLPGALAAYSRARRGALGFYQRATRWLTPLFQSDDAALAPLRDVGLALLSRAPLFERRMLESMAGMSTGWLSATPVGPA